jgi:isopropylmalate/homocitrate/citramalate synthase
VTLRDGSYLIDFQFTAEDTATIAAALEATGFHWIEVGHGLGLNASHAGKGLAAATDEEYMKAAAEALKRAK